VILTSNAAREIMVDNFTLQGSYCFLRPELKKNGILAEECISNLIESVVIYDKIYVPDDVLKLNSACKEIVDQFDNVITGKAGTQLADYHHEIVDKEILQRFIPLLQRKDPFMKFNNREAWSIEETGYPWSSSPGYMGKYDRPLQFGERQWSESLNNEKAKKKVNLAMPFIGGPSVDINVPIPNPSALDKRLHYVFIHTLLSAVNF
jgi:hypothetical protein